MVLQMLLHSSSKDREGRGRFRIGRQSIPEGCNAKVYIVCVITYESTVYIIYVITY